MAKSRNYFWLWTTLILGGFFASPAFGGINRGGLILAAEKVIASAVSDSPLVISDEFTGQSLTLPPPVVVPPPTVTVSSNIGTERSFTTAAAPAPVVTADERSFRTSSESIVPIGALTLSAESSFRTATSSTTTPEVPPEPPPGGGSSSGGGGGGSGRGRLISAVAAPATFPPCPVYLTKFIKFGAANDSVEVRKLQLFLRDYMGLEVPVTGSYDEATFAAVKIFQLRYGAAILKPWGIDYPTGYVYITTTLAINNLYCERDPANTLDLRSQFPPLSGVNLESTTTRPPPVLPEVGRIEPPPSVSGWLVAAIGLLDFIRDHPWWWLTVLVILILLIFLTPNRRQDHEDG